MKSILFAPQFEKWNLKTTLLTFSGLVPVEDQFSFQPLGSLATDGSKDDCKLGIRIIQKITDLDSALRLDFVTSATSIVTIYDRSNEKETLRDFLDKCYEFHRSQFEFKKANTILKHYESAEMREEDKMAAVQSLSDFLWGMFR
ncbi:MAG TPA: hypothetical protein VE978_20680 [Chitinophagales bacterium]|nr:hypothetical protein [Chitinophagales bacterium]